ncbi:response regulator [Flavobacterium sp.]|uniref:response regulator n=1 Tax=Flavobacterium sp. TaxID=239 RepID=UPI003C3AD973
MFNKVIISEDFDSINLAVIEVLKECKIHEVEYTKYCDDALLKIKRALLDETPYDLLLTDLSFIEDHRVDTLTLKSGEDLIAAVRAIQPDIKIIVYSIEDKSYRIKSLFENHDIDGYVMKGRNSVPELKNALTLVYNSDQKYLSPTITHVLQDKTVNEIDNYDLELLKYLSIGVAQDQMESQFKMLNISPNSKSSIEKRINKLKTYFKANNTIHLIAISKDLGLI